jgi:hypothetical protein
VHLIRFYFSFSSLQKSSEKKSWYKNFFEGEYMTDFLQAIHNKALETVKEFKKKETELIEILMEIDSHKVFLHLGLNFRLFKRLK